MGLGYIIFAVSVLAVALAVLQNFVQKKPQKIHHPFFGDLLFFDMGNTQKNYCEGRASLKPPVGDIEVFIDCNEDGPDDQQFPFCKNLAENYDILAADFQALQPSGSTQDFWNEFKCTGLSVPRKGDKNKSWNITFEHIKSGRLHTLNYEGGKAVEIIIDG